MTTEFISATEALDKFFEVIRQEAEQDLAFEHRLVDALGANIKYVGDDALKVVDPVLLAMRGHDEFRATFLTFRLKELKDIATTFNIATSKDLSAVRGQSAIPRLVDIMWEGAWNKLRDIRASAD
jgi:hypothetical protein